MKRNSSVKFSPFSCLSSVTTDSGIETECAIGWSRRSFLAAVGIFLLMPRHALARLFQCGPDLRISVLTSLTGPYAGVQSKYFEGVQEAVDTAKARGCQASIFVRDADPSPPKLILGALAAAKSDRASVIIAPFGPIVGRYVAQRAGSAVIFDISQTSPAGSRPANLVTLPYALFLTANPAKKSESLRTLGKVACTIVLETIQSSSPGTITSPGDMIEAMARRKFSSPKGPLTLNRTTGTFELIK